MEALPAFWAVGALIVFVAGLASTPSESISGNAIGWMAFMAVLWPVIVLFCATGILLTFLASIGRGK